MNFSINGCYKKEKKRNQTLHKDSSNIKDDPKTE
jgi:hypothetical protein